MIYFDSVSKIYSHNSAALKNVTLRIHPKEFVSLVGASGAGKSTLLKLLIREEEPTSGKILLDGMDITQIPRGELHHIRRRIGTVFQDYKLLSAKTAYENVAFAMEVCGYPMEKIIKDVPKILELVGILQKRANFPHQMSGGEKQRVAIARALAHRPVLLLADEPTGNLDEINAGEVLDLLLKINSLGTTVILATHASDLVNKIQRRVITIEEGRITHEQEKGKYKL